MLDIAAFSRLNFALALAELRPAKRGIKAARESRLNFDF
jgi:hypothetical protein